MVRLKNEETPKLSIRYGLSGVTISARGWLAVTFVAIVAALAIVCLAK